MRLWMTLTTVCLAVSGNCYGVTIDSFSAGALVQGPELTELQMTQDSLAPASVLGGAREWIANYGGSLAVNSLGNGSLLLDHDRGIFEVASLRYGELVSGSTIAPLNADLTTSGHSQLTLRIRRMQIDPADGHSSPLVIGLNLRSGAGTAAGAGAIAYVNPHNSDDSYVIQVPFTSFTASQQPLDFADVDGIGLSFFFQGHGRIEIDDISTSAGLPGDYDLSGSVDAADFTVWRDLLGQTTPLPNENPLAQTRGLVDDEDFEFWRSRFGNTFSTGSMHKGAAVPEASVACLLWSALLTLAANRLR